MVTHKDLLKQRVPRRSKVVKDPKEKLSQDLALLTHRVAAGQVVIDRKTKRAMERRIKKHG